MEYEWDESKRLSNIEKHGIDFVDAPEILERTHLLSEGHQGRGSEIRFMAMGEIDDFVAVVVFTMRGEVCRIISLRRARKDERRSYHEAVHD